MWTSKSPVVRKVLLVVGLLVVNLGSLLVLGAGYLVSRLEGSQPPTVMQYLAPIWLPVALIAAVNVLMIAVYWNRRARH